MRGDPSVEYEILKARESAERTLGFVIDDETAEEVLDYAKRKCELTTSRMSTCRCFTRTR